jgi:hypothetical protein
LPPNDVINRSVGVTLSPKWGMPMVVRAHDRRFAAGEWRGDVRGMVEP